MYLTTQTKDTDKYRNHRMSAPQIIAYAYHYISTVILSSSVSVFTSNKYTFFKVCARIFRI